MIIIMILMEVNIYFFLLKSNKSPNLYTYIPKNKEKNKKVLIHDILIILIN